MISLSRLFLNFHPFRRTIGRVSFLRKQDLVDQATEYTSRSEDNDINEAIALSESLKGVKIFDDPIFAFAEADDPLFFTLKNETIIGEHFRLPVEWMVGAKSVISFFLPFSEAIRIGNRRGKIWPSAGWLHGRIEGQAFIGGLCQFLQGILASAGYRSEIPSMDRCFQSRSGPGNMQEEANPCGKNLPFFTSNWSERHIAMVCGLGSFGLSKGLITSKGVAGRFGSLVTDLTIEPNVNRFENFLSYCRSCGACIEQCPAKAISFEHGKDHFICSEFLDRIRDRFRPRYGCGKCQVGVPCESGMPFNEKNEFISNREREN